VFTVPRIRPKVWYPTSLLSLPSGIKVLSLGAVLAISAIDEDIPGEMEIGRGVRETEREEGREGGRVVERVRKRRKERESESESEVKSNICREI
jgi:hypothetical protein